MKTTTSDIFKYIYLERDCVKMILKNNLNCIYIYIYNYCKEVQFEREKRPSRNVHVDKQKFTEIFYLTVYNNTLLYYMYLCICS